MLGTAQRCPLTLAFVLATGLFHFLALCSFGSSLRSPRLLPFLTLLPLVVGLKSIEMTEKQSNSVGLRIAVQC